MYDNSLVRPSFHLGLRDGPLSLHQRCQWSSTVSSPVVTTAFMISRQENITKLGEEALFPRLVGRVLSTFRGICFDKCYSYLMLDVSLTRPVPFYQPSFCPGDWHGRLR